MLVFTNSSHWTYVADTSGDEEMYYEALCPDGQLFPKRMERAAKAAEQFRPVIRQELTDFLNGNLTKRRRDHRP